MFLALSNCTAIDKFKGVVVIELKWSNWFNSVHHIANVTNSALYLDKIGYILNVKIALAELLPLEAK